MPVFRLAEGTSAESLLDMRCNEGIMAKFPDGLPEEYRERLAFEKKVINDMNLPTTSLLFQTM